MMLKKIMALVLSPAVLAGSLTNISFAVDPPSPDTQANRASFTVFLPQNEPTDPVLSKEEKEANKLEGYLSEKIQDCYSDIIKESPCMKVAFEDIQQITSKKFPGSSKENKLLELEAEKKSLLAYKKKIEENNKDNEGIKKQLKNIDDRLLAIDYTENFLNNYQKDYKLALGIGLGVLFGFVLGTAFVLSIQN